MVKKRLNPARIITSIFAFLLVLYFMLMIPWERKRDPVTLAEERPFTWNRDAFWKMLEGQFQSARLEDQTVLATQVLRLQREADSLAMFLESNVCSPSDAVYPDILKNFFSLSSLTATWKPGPDWLLSHYSRVRIAVKRQSQSWDMSSRESRNTLYQCLYGMRAATEEVLLQQPGMRFQPVMPVMEEPSVTPSARIFGITLHSGDLLVSRGGAVVSALISRGNDYPGNFSHVAVIYIDEKTSIPYLIEAHIEKGLAISSVAQYVADRKLRFMVMRPRADLPLMIRDPMIPHQAARYMYHLAGSRHIPYDFGMDLRDTITMFCSEVASTAYSQYGFHLWEAISTISSPGIVRLLNDFGVTNFVTMMPSDLEYDPQLSVVAEWRDPATLLKDHIYNASMDVILEQKDPAAKLEINPWMLPLARSVKAWSWVLNRFRLEGPVPEGMTAIQGLRNQAFVSWHDDIRLQVERKILDFIEKKGYMPPYWQLVEMAREPGSP